MVGVGEETGLAPGEGVGVYARIVEGHAHQGAGLALAGGDEHVQFPARLGGRHCGCQGQQIVGLLAHGADHQHNLVASVTAAAHMVGHLADALRVGHRRAAELLHH